MTAILTVKAAPLFLTKNYLNGFSVVTVSSGDGFKQRAFDMTRTSAWTSQGFSTSPTTPQTYNARLFEGSAQVLRKINFIAILNTNIKRFKLEFSATDGAPFTIFDGLDFTASDFTGADKLVSLASDVDANRILLTVTEIQSGSEVSVGDIVIGELLLQTAQGMTTYNKRYRDSVKTIQMADGSMDYTYILRSDTSHEFYSSSVAFRGVSQANRDLLRAIKTQQDPFIFVPEPGDVPGDMFLSRITPNSYDETYISMERSAGYGISFGVEEIGAE